MALTVVQSDLTAPTAEQLVRAYEAVPSLVAGDARRTARYCFGIIAENLADDEAHALAGELTAMGVPAQAINPQDMPELPAAQSIRRIDCLDPALLIYQTIQPPQSVAWEQLVLIALGEVDVVETHVVHEMRYPYTDDRYGRGGVNMPVDVTRQEKTTSHVLLEICTDAGERWQCDEEVMLFNYLPPERARTRRQRLVCVVEDLLRLAPRAVANRGAISLPQMSNRPQRYVNQKMFERETRWLLWWSRRSQ